MLQVLLGDAAHSLLNVTHLGTGLALEDCLVLDRLLQASLQSQHDGSDVMQCIASALSSFSDERIPEMAAAAQLCSEVSRTNMYDYSFYILLWKLMSYQTKQCFHSFV